MKLLEELKSLCVNHYGKRLQSLVVFGSVARGSFSPDSDIDLLLVLKRRKVNYAEFCEYYENVESRLLERYRRVEINPIFKRKSELHTGIPYLWDTDFVILYDSEGFFTKFLKELEEFKKTHLRYREGNLRYIEILK